MSQSSFLHRWGGYRPVGRARFHDRVYLLEDLFKAPRETSPKAADLMKISPHTLVFSLVKNSVQEVVEYLSQLKASLEGTLVEEERLKQQAHRVQRLAQVGIIERVANINLLLCACHSFSPPLLLCFPCTITFVVLRCWLPSQRTSVFIAPCPRALHPARSTPLSCPRLACRSSWQKTRR